MNDVCNSVSNCFANEWIKANIKVAIPFPAYAATNLGLEELSMFAAPQ